MHSALTVRMFTRCAGATFAGVMFVALGTSVNAAPIVFTDRAAFNAAAQPNVFDDFSAPVQCTIVFPFCDLSYSGVTFTFDSLDYPISPVGGPQSIGALDVGPLFAVTVKFAPSTSIGFDVFQLGSNPFGLVVTPRIVQQDGTETVSSTMTFSTPGFFGLHVNDGTWLAGLVLGPIQSSSSSTLAGIDNLATTVPVPEPATLLLFSVGASVLLARRRQRRG